MNWSSGVCPSRNFAASLSKSSNSRSMIGIRCPGTFSYASGFSIDPSLPFPACFLPGCTSSLCSAAIRSAAVVASGAEVGSIAPPYYTNPDWD